MKKSLLLASAAVLSAALLLINPAGAQPSDRPERDPAARLEQMQKNLELTDAQTASIRSIMQDSSFSMEQIRNNTSLTPDQRREQAKEARELVRTRVDGVLTPEQKEKRDEMRPDRKGDKAKDKKDGYKKDKPKKDKPKKDQSGS